MKTTPFPSLLLLALMAVPLCAPRVQAAVNLAVVAKPSASHVSGDCSVAALNDAGVPGNSGDRRAGAYGNWPSTGTQWVEYEWDRAISTDKTDVYWWDDRQGVRLPAAARLLYWDGRAFAPVKTDSTLGVVADRFNPLGFEEVTTNRLRLEIDSTGGSSTGILEWRVFDSGKSPAFPPDVTAGEDRVVVLGGKTYLSGEIKTLSDPAAAAVPIRWSKVSGPGEVTFENPDSAVTSATFSAIGRYVLQLTAGKESLAKSSELSVQVAQPPPAAQLKLIDTGAYTLNSPFWDRRARAIITHWIPHCIRKINEPDLREGGINNFIEAAKKLRGEPAGQHQGYVFSNAWIYNTIESICIALMVDPKGDPEVIAAQQGMRETLEDWIPKVLAAQEPDGYLQTVFTLSEREHWSPKHRDDHEGYVAGYFLEAAVSHYMLTGGSDLRLYNAAKKLADCWESHIGPAPKQEWFDGHQAMEMALVRFGRFVNKIEGAKQGEKYIRLAKFLLDFRKNGSEYDQSHVSVVRQYEAVGHAVRASYNYAAMSDVAMETHNLDYQSAVLSLADNLINRKYYLTGGIGSGETSEGFGPDYSLRHNAYNEACSSCGLIFFEHKLNLAYHEARYADLYEETLYNALLGSIDLEAENFYYQNPLDARGARYPWHGCPCCVGNIPRVLLMLPTWAYLSDSDSVYVNLFLGSTITVPGVAGTDVRMVQETDYPWSGNVTLTVNPERPSRFHVRIRMPNREVSNLYHNQPAANGITSIKVNGELIQPAEENGYAVIERTWQAGDKIELVLPMVIQRVKADDRVAAIRGQVALRYGPLIYSAESADQDISKVLSPDAPLTTEWRPDLLDGVMVIKGNWSDGSEFLAIPNYARSNRLRGTGQADQGFGGPGTAGSHRNNGGPDSSVWLKDQ